MEGKWDIKVCPRCKAEFRSHVDECSDCHVPLVFRETLDRENPPGRLPPAGTLPRETAPVVEGMISYIQELGDVLRERGIPNWMGSCAECPPGSCTPRYQLLVERRQAEEAHRAIEDHYRQAYPEIAQAEQRAAQGLCPACGSPLEQDAAECGDCGLVLAVRQEG